MADILDTRGQRVVSHALKQPKHVSVNLRSNFTLDYEEWFVIRALLWNVDRSDSLCGVAITCMPSNSEVSNQRIDVCRQDASVRVGLKCRRSKNRDGNFLIALVKRVLCCRGSDQNISAIGVSKRGYIFCKFDFAFHR